MKLTDVPYPKLSLAYAIASGFYSGCIPVITRGTAGSIVSALFGVMLWQHGGSLALFIGAALWFFMGWWAVARIEQACDPKYHDASVFVADEWCGQWLCLAVAMPLFYENFGFAATLFSLLSFAIFDGLKPWPIRKLDQYITGGFGVMIDDVAAAAGACGLMLIAAKLLWFV